MHQLIVCSGSFLPSSSPWVSALPLRSSNPTDALPTLTCESRFVFCSGAGPTAVAITDSEEKGKKIGEAMQAAFAENGRLKSTAAVLSLNREGARVVS